VDGSSGMEVSIDGIGNIVGTVAGSGTDADASPR
jgi:hypothetical protein